jgi:hypothetical protein
MSTLRTLANFLDWYSQPFEYSDRNDKVIIQEPEFPKIEFFTERDHIVYQIADKVKLREDEFQSHLMGLKHSSNTPTRRPLLIGNQTIDLSKTQPILPFAPKVVSNEGYCFEKLKRLMHRSNEEN